MADDPMWDAFANAVVTLSLPTGSAVLRPADPGTTDDFGFDAPVHIITAFNPAGVEADPHENEARHHALCVMLEQRELWWHGSVGSAPDGSFAEPGCAVLAMDTEDALEVAREFGQRAIYVWTEESLRILGVDEPVDLAYGWKLEHAPHDGTSGPSAQGISPP